MNDTSESHLPVRPAVTAEELRRLAEDYRDAETRLAKAKRAVEDDKARRAREGVLAQLSDAIRETPEEWELGNATRVFNFARQFASEAALRWMKQRSRELAVTDSSKPWSCSAVQRYLDVERLHIQLADAHRLAVNAVAILERGAGVSASAGAADMQNALQSWPQPSISLMGISIGARAAMHDAGQAIEKLRAALPESMAADVKAVDPDFEQFVALLHRQNFDAAHWYDTGMNESVATKLAITARMLTPLRVYLGQLVDKTMAELKPLTAEAEQTIATYRDTARNEMPTELGRLVLLAEKSA